MTKKLSQPGLGKIFGVGFLLLVLSFSVVFQVRAVDFSPSYPRIGIFHFGSAPADWYAKHDLVMAGSVASTGSKIKAINSNTIILPTKGWTAYVSASSYPIPSSDFDKADYLVHDSTGAQVYINCCNRIIDQSSYSRPAASGRFAGQSILKALPIQAIENSKVLTNDGVATDWLWVKPYGTSDVDLDRNGQNDYSEHGGSWVNSRWQEGTTQLLANLRFELSKFGSQKVSLVNFGFQFQKVGTSYINGMVREWTTGFGSNFKSGYFWNDEYKYFMEKAPTPHVALIDGRPSRSDPFIKALTDTTDSRNHLQAMRFLLGATLLGDAYFNFMTFEEATSTQNHHIHAWYDEFDVDLGQPTDLGQSGPLDDAQEVKDGVWLRFFDKGVSIVNVNGSPQTVSDGDLKGLPGYNGPYWRFAGGQDFALNGASAINNGQALGSITLEGYTYVQDNKDKIVGDGAILLKSPKKIVSGIVVDNRGFSTSPGSQKASLTGGFSQQKDGGREHWSVYSASKGRAYEGVDYWHPYALSDTGGEARFVPNIGIGGNYEVFEWHGYLGDDPSTITEASNVKLTIDHADGSSVKFGDICGFSLFNLTNDQNINISLASNVTNVRYDGGAPLCGGTGPTNTPTTKPTSTKTPTPTNPPTGGPTATPTLTSTLSRPGDLDEDGDIDIFDYNVLLENFGSTNCGNVADINMDCSVDIFDYNILIQNFGTNA